MNLEVKLETFDWTDNGPKRYRLPAARPETNQPTKRKPQLVTCE